MCVEVDEFLDHRWNWCERTRSFPRVGGKDDYRLENALLDLKGPVAVLERYRRPFAREEDYEADGMVFFLFRVGLTAIGKR